MIMILDNDVGWQWASPSLVSRPPHTTHDTPGPAPRLAKWPASPSSLQPRPGTGLFSHCQRNAASHSRHFLSVLFLFFQAEAGDREWRVTRGWRGGWQRLTSPGAACVLCQARLCPVSPPHWPLQPPPALLYSRVSLLWLVESCSYIAKSFLMRKPYKRSFI